MVSMHTMDEIGVDFVIEYILVPIVELGLLPSMRPCMFGFAFQCVRNSSPRDNIMSNLNAPGSDFFQGATLRSGSFIVE